MDLKKKVIIRLKEKTHYEKPSNSKHPNFNLREIALQALYQIDIASSPLKEILELKWVHTKLNENEKQFIQDIVESISNFEIEIDNIIQQYSSKDIRQISSIVRCILRLGTYEIIKEEFPAPIIIDTCCRLTRKYDDEKAVKFVNAILDKIYKFLVENQEDKKENIKRENLR